MSLSSIPFIFQFLPVFLLLYYLIPRQWWRSVILLLGSLFFFTWIDPNHLHILLLSVICNYIFGRLIGRVQSKQDDSKTAFLLTTAAVTGNLGLLIYYKYSNFLIANFQWQGIFEWDVPQALLPLGISYFTFTGIAYIVDVYHRVEAGERNFIKFANSMIMFPKIMLGPITRYGQVKNKLGAAWFVNEHFMEGLKRFVSGLGKKIILADHFAIVADKVFIADFSQITPSVAWFGILSYALQLFFDFSGYTDMAIGLGLMLGYRLPENFNFPYIANSVSDFWRRWHMTLTGWFRTYLFIPLEFRYKKRNPKIRQPLNILFVFLLTGLWHGAGWNFILWGGYYGILLALEAIVLGKWLKKIPHVFQHAYTILAILVGWVFFKISDIPSWGVFFKSLLGMNAAVNEITLRSMNILLFASLIPVGILFSTPLFKNLEIRLASIGVPGKLCIFAFYAFIFILSISFILSNGYLSFLYTQF